MTRHRKRRYSARTIAKARLVAVSQPPAGTTADTENMQCTIRQHPWAALAVGAGVGVMLGMSPKLRNSVVMSLLHLVK